MTPILCSPKRGSPIFCCHNCHRLLLPQDRFCDGCGTAVSPLPCPTCGAVTPTDDDGFCNQCGFRSPTPAADHQEQALSPQFAAVSDRGLCRSRNQDAVAIALAPASLSGHSPGSHAYATLSLCDGIASSPRAELAAQTASVTVVNSILGAIAQADTAVKHHPQLTLAQDPQSLLHQALHQAQQEVAALSSPTAPAPSTTTVTALVSYPSARPAHPQPSPWPDSQPSRASPPDSPSADRAPRTPVQSYPTQITLAWLGDSRAYWLSPSGSHCLTQDHANDQQQLTHWLGNDTDLSQSPPQFSRFSVPGPGALLLCSDGLWNYAPAAEQLQALVFPPAQRLQKVEDTTEVGKETAIAIATRLVEFALAQGGQDNITVALLLFP